MLASNFEWSLRRLNRRRRFRPYVVELTSGDQFTVSHPEALAGYGGVLAHVSPDKSVRYFDAESVCQLIDERNPPPR